MQHVRWRRDSPRALSSYALMLVVRAAVGIPMAVALLLLVVVILARDELHRRGFRWGRS